MSEQYFTPGMTVDEVRHAYRALAMRWHPDRPGGDTATMQAINAAYEAALKSRDGEEVSYEAEGGEMKTRVYHWNAAVEREIIDVIDKLLKLRMPNVTIRLIGRWVWAEGEIENATYPYRKDLGKDGIGLFYHGKRKAWYWKPQGWHSHYNKHASLDDLENAYGGREYRYTEQGVTR